MGHRCECKHGANRRACPHGELCGARESAPYCAEWPQVLVNSLQEVTKSGVGDFHEFVQVGTGASGCAMSGRRLKYSHAAPATALFGIALRLHALPITRGPTSPAHDSARLGPDQPSCVVAYAKCICRADWRAVARASLPVPLPCVQRHHSGTPIAAHRLVVLQTLAIAAGSTPLPSDA